MRKNSILWAFLIVSIIIIFLFNKLLAIWVTLVLLVLAIIVYIYSLTFKRKIIRTIQKYNRITDTDIAEELNSRIEKIRDKLAKLHKHQKKRIGLFVFLNSRYIFYNDETINEFKQLYSKGLKEKEILENLKKSIDIKTRAEVKVIKDTLINHKKLEKKDIEIQIKDQIRKSELY
ncbi:MAG: hypothetical protein ACFFEY_11855 [Candidatus Thorarchaeota archaeon]